jgi:hypothetical protein
VLDVGYLLVCFGLTLLPTCLYKVCGGNGASFAQRAMGLTLVREVQQPVELAELPASRRSMAATPGRPQLAMVTPQH